MTEPVDRLLARRLADPVGPPEDCPSPELLAALVEGALRPDERARVEHHASSCGRCTEHLALLAATDPAELAPAESPKRSWLRWTWLVPAMATVLVAAVWVAIPEHERTAVPASSRVAPAAPPAAPERSGSGSPAGGPASSTLQGAASPPPAAPPAEESAPAPPQAKASPPAVASKADEPLADADRQAPADRLEARRDQAARPAAAAGVVPPPQSPTAPVPGSPAIRERAGGAAANEASAEHDKAEAKAAPLRKTAPEVTSESMTVAGQAANAGSVAGGAGTDLRAPASAAAAGPPPRAGFAALAAGDKQLAAIVGVDVANSPIRWRVVGGDVQRSADEGRTWSPDGAPRLDGVIAGSAPTADVCWLVTMTGTVLRRGADGHWVMSQVPGPVTVSGVVARSAADATVLTRDQGPLVTTDGGVTWRRR